MKKLLVFVGFAHTTKTGATVILAKPRRPDNARLTASSFEGFLGWLRRNTTVLEALRVVKDGRDPGRTRIPLPSILLGVLCLFWLGWPSLKALDDHLRLGGRLRRVLAGFGWAGGIADDTFRDALSALDLERLRGVLHGVCRRAMKGWGAGTYLHCALAERLRPLRAQRLASRAVVAIDGHHFFTSKSSKRCCADCLSREVMRGKRRVTEYYHMAVVAQWVGTHPALVLDFEPLRPGENELVAVKRLLPRLKEAYGKRLGILLADAFYDNEPFRRLAADLGYRTVIVHKDDRRDPGASAVRALDARDPRRENPDARHAARGTVYHVWEEAAGGRRLIEVRRTDRRGAWKSQAMTDLEGEWAPAVAVGMLLEERWSIENTGFHELVGAWHLDRVYVHAGRPTAAWAIVLLALLAYNAFQLFAYRYLRLDPRRPERSLAALRRDLVTTLGVFGRRGTARARAP